MKPILILQSCAPNAPQWVDECMQSVWRWALHHGHRYIKMGDELFVYAAEFCRPPFNKVTRSDICRLRMIQTYLATGNYSAVVWIDSDVLIWDLPEFVLPEAQVCGVICAREAFHMHDGCVSLFVNNSIVGLSNLDDAAHLIEVSERILSNCDPITPPRTTIIGPDLFSSSRLPLRRLIAKSAGCLSAQSINIILGPHVAACRHLRFLGLANGATLHAANLCSSRENDPARMQHLIATLLCMPTQHLDFWKYITPFYRTWLRINCLPQRLRCWTITRARNLLTLVSGKT